MPKPILVVEDSLTQAERLRLLLQQAFGNFPVNVAHDGAAALKQINEQPPGLIISDIVMPRMDGYTMCSHLKADPRHKNIPIILLTSLSDPEDIIHGLNAGTDYYLTKPYDEGFLLEKVGSILRNPRGPEENGDAGWKVNFAGKEHVVHADLQQMINLLLSTYENAVQQNRKLMQAQEELRQANEGLEGRVAERTHELSVMNRQLLVEVGERKRAEERLQSQLQRIEALRQVEAAMSGSLDLRVFLNVLLDVATHQLHVDAAEVLLLKPMSLHLEVAATRGIFTRRNTGAFESSESPAAMAVRERKNWHIPDMASQPEAVQQFCLAAQEGFQSYVAVPLVAKGRTLGVLEVFHRAPLAMETEWVEFLETLARQAAIAIDSALLFEDVQRTNMELFRAYDSTLEGWSRALDMRDKETEGHSLRVTEMSQRIAAAMGVSPTELAHMRRGALLHDIGKLAVPDSILRKPEPLAEEERAIMEMHPFHAYQMLSPIAFLRDSLDIPYCHHEKWDGTGYPRALKGEQIPLAARIFAIADVWDALRSQRPYRDGWGRAQCLQYVVAQRGTHFDPAVVDTFLQLFGENGDGFDPVSDNHEASSA